MFQDSVGAIIEDKVTVLSGQQGDTCGLTVAFSPKRKKEGEGRRIYFVAGNQSLNGYFNQGINVWDLLGFN